jgi:hypothetical protein
MLLDANWIKVCLVYHNATFFIIRQIFIIGPSTKKPYSHQISLDYKKKLVERIEIEEMDCNTCSKMQEILRCEIDDPGFL